MEFLNGLTMGRRRFSALAIPRSGLRLSITNNGDGTATWRIAGYEHPDSGGFISVFCGDVIDTEDYTSDTTAYNATSGSITVDDPSAPMYFTYVAYDEFDSILQILRAGPLTITGDTAAAAWIAAEEAAGYTFSAGEKDATHTAFGLLRSNDLLTHLYFVQLLCLGTSARNAIPLYNPLGLSNTFGSGITHNAKSITYNGTTNGFNNTDFVPSTDGWTLNSAVFGYYLVDSLLADSSSLQGCRGSSDDNTIQASTRFPTLGTFCDFGPSNRMSATGTGLKGLRNYIRISETTGYISRYDEDGANELASKTNMSNASFSLPGVPFYFGARNFNGSVNSPTTEKHSLEWIGGGGMTTAERDIFDVVMYNLLDAFGAL
jgi:hypothetical protein